MQGRLRAVFAFNVCVVIRVNPQLNRGSVVVAAFVVVATFAWGLCFYGLGFYMLKFQSQRGWSLSASSNLILLFYLTAVPAAFVVSKTLARRGPQPVVAFGAISIGLALLALSHVHLVWVAVPVYLLLSVGWSCTSVNTISTVILAWYPNGQRQLALALVGASIGGIILVPLMSELESQVGLTTALTMLAVVETAIVGTLALLVLRDPPQVRNALVEGPRDVIAWHLCRDPDYWILAATLGLGILVQGGFLMHQMTLLAESLSEQTAARIVGMATLAALLGRMGPIIIGRRIRAARVGIIYLLIQATALLLLSVLPHNTVWLTFTSCLYGLGVGVLITMPPLLTEATFPLVPFTAAYPVVNLSWQICLAIGAPLVAVGRTRLDNYDTVMFVSGVGLLAAVGFAVINDRRVRVKCETWRGST